MKTTLTTDTAAAHRAARLVILALRAATPAAAEQLMHCARDWAAKAGLTLDQCTRLAG